MQLLITILVLVSSTTVLAEQLVCSASYDDGSSTLTATFERVESGFNGFFLTASPYLDRPERSKRFFGETVSSSYEEGDRAYSKTIAIEHGRSLSFIKQGVSELEVHYIDLDDMGFTSKHIYGGKTPVILGGETINEDINQNYMVGSCVKRD